MIGRQNVDRCDNGCRAIARKWVPHQGKVCRRCWRAYRDRENPDYDRLTGRGRFRVGGDDGDG